MTNPKTKKTLAKGALDLYHILRQGRESVAKGYRVAMIEEKNKEYVGDVYLFAKNSGVFVPNKTIIEANQVTYEERKFKKVISKEKKLVEDVEDEEDDDFAREEQDDPNIHRKQ
jgi:hypothetical protein